MLKFLISAFKKSLVTGPLGRNSELRTFLAPLVSPLSSLLSRLSSLVSLTLLVACSDFFEPVDSTPAPTEYAYNYWLLQKTYLFEDELPLLVEEGDSVQVLYDKLSDPFTRYVPPSKSEDAISHINTSIVPGDVGMEYTLFSQKEYPLTVYRVYADGPAGRAGVPRYGNILQVNGVGIMGENALGTYDSILTNNKDLEMVIAYNGDTAVYRMTKEDIYAPTVFVDTLDGIPVITITAFKPNTVNREDGTLGELKAYLDSTKDATGPRLIDLRNNPGGHVNQCVAMADLFIREGPVSTRRWRSFMSDGKSVHNTQTVSAAPGDAGENGKFVALVNGNSASCAEIFVAAISEGAGIPVAGTTTYGKGIGQSTWKTTAGGLAIITNLEFLTPKDNSYHKKGIVPDYPCESATLVCGLNAVQNFYAKTGSKKADPMRLTEKKVLPRQNSVEGGAFIEGDAVPFF